MKFGEPEIISNIKTMTALEAQHEVITDLILENKKLKQERDEALKCSHNMSPQLIKYTIKVDSLRDILKQHGFKNIEFFWHNDGICSGNWKDMSVAMEKPDRDTTFTLWNFGFRSTAENNKRIKLNAIATEPSHGDEIFHFDLSYYPEVVLHDRHKFYGPSARLEVSGILERDLTNLQKYIDYLVNLK